MPVIPALTEAKDKKKKGEELGYNSVVMKDVEEISAYQQSGYQRVLIRQNTARSLYLQRLTLASVCPAVMGW
jgi:hypothetical protein